MRAKEEKDALVTDNMNLVYWVLHTYYPNHVKNEDVVQEGMLGLVIAADTWDETKSKFSTYATVCILNQIRPYFRRESRHMNNISIDSEYTTDDGSKISLVEAIVGDEDINTKAMDFDTFFNSLSENEQSILTLMGAGYLQKEICAMLNKSHMQVYSTKMKIRKKWREFYEDNQE